MNKYEKIKSELTAKPKTWLITGCAGFIGSNLLETLLKLNQLVVGLDNFSNGFKHNLDEVKNLVSAAQWSHFKFKEGDIRDYAHCIEAIDGVDHILHQAALGSVPRSINDPITTNASNIDGFLNMLTAAKDYEKATFTYAASSSTYGDHHALPKVEEHIGQPLSPYAVTKYVNELYADVFLKTYDFKSIGLRYFNVFGKRQTPFGAYAAVIPKWTGSLIQNENVIINGDGETSRDFCYIENAIQANILAATSDGDAKGEIYNVAYGDQTSLNDLLSYIRATLSENGLESKSTIKHQDFRPGDVRHSKANISKAKAKLRYDPTHKILSGIKDAMPWYIQYFKNASNSYRINS